MTPTLPKHFHAVFSLLMALIMVTIVTGVVSAVNVGLGPDFPAAWLKSFIIAYPVAVACIYFLAPKVRAMAMRLTAN